jgi:hypothetical protein
MGSFRGAHFANTLCIHIEYNNKYDASSAVKTVNTGARAGISFLRKTPWMCPEDESVHCD